MWVFFTRLPVAKPVANEVITMRITRMMVIAVRFELFSIESSCFNTPWRVVWVQCLRIP